MHLPYFQLKQFVQKFQNASMNRNGGVYCSDQLLMQILKLHMQHLQIMMLCHDIMLHLMVSLFESYF